MFSEHISLREPQDQKSYPTATTKDILEPIKCQDRPASPYVPALSSRASRKISLRSRGSCRGSIVVRINGQLITLTFESLLELMVIMLLVARDDVVEIWDQPPAITYTDPDNRKRHHTFDFRVVLNCGRTLAIAVKPSRKASRADFQIDMSHVAKALPVTFADDLVVVTEQDFTRAQAVNAARFMEFCKQKDVEADAATGAAIDRINGTVSIASIVAETGLAGRAYRSVVRAIFRNELKPKTPNVISPSMFVTPAQKMGV